jgi:glycosyltransferase involved in cell wall biosynthesis
LSVTGRVDSTLTLGATAPQKLGGGGVINGTLVENAGSTVTPGNGVVPAVLTVSNSATLNGNVVMDLNRASGAITNDRIVAPSKAILDALVADENADDARCLAIPNGVDVERFLPASAPGRSQLRAALGFAGSECLIGCVASFTPVKRHAMLLEAFARVHRANPECRLVLVGDGPLRAEIETRARELGISGAVHFLGARADIEQILPALDIFVLASSTEGMSNAILEAQACGLPVVATAVGGNPELIEHQVTGLLVPVDEAGALALALQDLAGDPGRRTALGAAASRMVARDHSLAAMAAAYGRLYHELVDSDPARAH